MAEIAFEFLAAAHEATRGTPVTPPTRTLPFEGLITPGNEVYRPVESRGELAEFHRSTIAREWAEWEGDGPLDVNALPFLLHMALDGSVTPTQPDVANAPNTYLWEFVRVMTTDDLKSSTFYWGDPNVQIFQGAYGMMDEFTFSADGTGTDGATMSASGWTTFPAKVAAPALPAQDLGPLISPLNMQLFIDTSSAIGTTEITGRVLSAELSMPVGISYKFIPAGPGAAKTYGTTGRTKTHPTATVTMLLPDATQYDLYDAESTVKMRVRLNGPISEDTLYYFVEFDIYGKLNLDSWGDFEGSNRTVQFVVEGEKDATLGSDLRVAVQNQLSALP